MAEPRILIVEDETTLGHILKDYFEANRYWVHLIEHGDDVLPWLNSNKVDLIILDLMLPGKDGLTLCKEFRQTPFIITTAKVDEIDRLIGLELGADDYICKPYSPREVVARAKNVLKRTLHNQVPDQQTKLTLNEDELSVLYGNKKVELSAVEFKLLATLTNRRGKIFSRNALMNNIYDDGRVVSDRTIDSHIKKLRKKINELDPEHELIGSVYGAGYRAL
ncbi:MAG: response regulator [Saccharospirillaceae bacterium]|nr:response regulator [Pseudomonadales bacterium]NRB79599.1 response regulator [Saccharospirillaceae bacterium]